ncbi:glycosyltransferase family 2 protein [Riemerella columbipharyngis]|uniref:N-terminal domain of galactosyltransferase n=1 Tax=Riemerella columbipharyngis TaxID=1071918 RepID=A0A1G7E6H4_9FLAO|nr:glycosyltransferase family 2 protein [Riemerella columbipharyngis]SDE59233.1 N-terminal domain of galactosyltransferase [Riemerella columbipharyngis]
MNKSPLIETSLLISTYNWPEALDLVLRSVQVQTILPDEILIADDGSGKETQTLIENWSKKSNVPIKHIWQEDKGFRLAEVRNQAIAQSQYGYIIQIDGDVVLHPYFVEDHKRFAQENCFVTGSRTLLPKEVTEEAFITKKINFSPFTKGIKNRFNAVRFPIFNFFYKPTNTPLEAMPHRIRGCNMGFWKQDLLDVNGYDEDFVGWGREDSDLVIRLAKKGCFRKKIKLAALQFHLYHKENSKHNLELNDQLMKRAMNAPDFWAKNGICK